MENIIDDYSYWETYMFNQAAEEFDSWGLDEAFSGGYYDSSSPDGAQSSSAASKNIVSERNRRKKLNERLFALRAVVPNITKMDKASIIKDAIGYIQELHDQENRIKSEISNLESGKYIEDSSFDTGEEMPTLLGRIERRAIPNCEVRGSTASSSPIEDLELRASYMGDKMVVISITCSRRRDTMIKLCEVFESLKLNIVTISATTFSEKLLQTVFIQADKEEKAHVITKIETAVAAINDPTSPMSS